MPVPTEELDNVSGLEETEEEDDDDDDDEQMERSLLRAWRVCFQEAVRAGEPSESQLSLLSCTYDSIDLGLMTVQENPRGSTFQRFADRSFFLALPGRSVNVLVRSRLLKTKVLTRLATIRRHYLGTQASGGLLATSSASRATTSSHSGSASRPDKEHSTTVEEEEAGSRSVAAHSTSSTSSSTSTSESTDSDQLCAYYASRRLLAYSHEYVSRAFSNAPLDSHAEQEGETPADRGAGVGTGTGTGAGAGAGRRHRRGAGGSTTEEQAPPGGWQYGQRREADDDEHESHRNPEEEDAGHSGRKQKKQKKPESAEERAERLAKREKPNYKVSGKLAAETNTSAGGVQLQWSEPPEARRPTNRWRLYVFRQKEQLEPLQVHRQSAYLFGKDTLVADVPTRHPTCSRQHAVLQYREVLADPEAAALDPTGPAAARRVVRPYLMDLRSVNGTFLNGERIKPARYYELREKDLIRFGLSSREYVLLNADDVHAIETKKM